MANGSDQLLQQLRLKAQQEAQPSGFESAFLRNFQGSVDQNRQLQAQQQLQQQKLQNELLLQQFSSQLKQQQQNTLFDQLSQTAAQPVAPTTSEKDEGLVGSLENQLASINRQIDFTSRVPAMAQKQRDLLDRRKSVEKRLERIQDRRIKREDDDRKRLNDLLDKFNQTEGADPIETSEIQGLSTNQGIELVRSKMREAKQRTTKEFKGKKALREELDSFFALDDVIQKERGTGLGRLAAGGMLKAKGFIQGDPTGRAVAAHDAASKRLRVKLVRAAGDVGNLNIVEQEAAEKIIPLPFDDAQTARIKRAFLESMVEGIDSNDSNLVKRTVQQFMSTNLNVGTEQQDGSSTFEVNGQQVTIREIK